MFVSKFEYENLFGIHGYYQCTDYAEYWVRCQYIGVYGAFDAILILLLQIEAQSSAHRNCSLI